MKFSTHYSKLDFPIFTTIRQNKGYYYPSQTITITTPNSTFSAEIASIRHIKKSDITWTMAQRDADCGREELIVKLENWYGKIFDDFILITLMKRGK
jgi:hypothetical protein